MPSPIFRTWCAAVSHMIAFQAKRFALAAWLLLVIAMIVGFAKLSHLGTQNQERISDIQRSRLESCETTYTSFHVIFDPFLPPKGHRTAKQKHDLAKFNAIIDKKIKECRHQVTPPPVKPK